MRRLSASLPLLVLSFGLAHGAPSDARQPTEDALARDVEDAVAINADYDSQGILPQQIVELKDLLARDYPATERGAELKARVYIELSRVYMRQDISPMAIQLLQDGIVDLTRYPSAEIALREQLIDVYRALGFAPQAIREHKRLRQLRSQQSRKDA